MAYTKAALLAVLATVSLYSIEAFAPLALPSGSRQNALVRPTFVSVSEVGDLGVASDDDESGDIDSANPEDIILSDGDLEDDEDAEGIEDDGEPPSWYLSQQRIDELRIKHRRHENDCGSPEFQVAGMTERISYLTKHLKIHPKDFSTRRGLVALVNKRRRLLNFLFSKDTERYVDLVRSLGIRHKPPSNVPDRREKYGRFPGQKKPKKHLRKK